MADDTRKGSNTTPEDLSKEALNVRPLNIPFSGKQWTDAKPPENANLMAGGTAHTAGGKAPDYTFQNAWNMVRADEFKDLAKKPCVRDSLMTGIGVGFGAGGLRAILGGNAYIHTTACISADNGCRSSVGFLQLGSKLVRVGFFRTVPILPASAKGRERRHA